jgi:tetratricopeptide (TPR) repeat protein
MTTDQNQPEHNDQDDSTLAIYLDGLAAMGDERWLEAIETMDRVLETINRPEGQQSVYQNQSVCYRALERFDDALAVLDKAEQVAPAPLDLLINRMIALSCTGRNTEAIALIESVMSRWPRESKEYNAPLMLGRLQEIAQGKISPHTFQVEFLLEAIAHNLEEDEPDRIESKARRMIELDPTRPEGQFYLGFALREQDRYQEALEAFMVTHRLDAGNATTLYNIGLSYMGMERLQEAIHWLERTLRRERDHQRALLELGNANEALGHRDRAIEWWKRALKIDPSWDLVQARLHEVGAGPEPQEPPLSPKARQYREVSAKVERRMHRPQIVENGQLSLTWEPEIGFVFEDKENVNNFSLHAGGPFHMAHLQDRDILAVMGTMKLIMKKITAQNTRDIAILVYYQDGSVFNYQAQFDGEERVELMTDGRFVVTEVPQMFKLRMNSDLNTPYGDPMHGVLIYLNQEAKPGVLVTTLGLLPDSDDI